MDDPCLLAACIIRQGESQRNRGVCMALAGRVAEEVSSHVICVNIHMHSSPGGLRLPQKGFLRQGVEHR